MNMLWPCPQETRMLDLTGTRSNGRGEMVNLGIIEQKLNQDPAYRREFLRDPVAALAREGISISSEVQDRLRNQVKDASGRGKAKLRFGMIINPCA
jgi:hypothetical protein